MGEIYKEKAKLPEKRENDEETKEVFVGEIILAPDLPILFRDKEIERVLNIMEKSENRSVMLVGDYGIGKRSVIEGFVKRNDDEGVECRVINFDFMSVLKMSNNKREFEDNLRNIFDGVKKDESKTNIINISGIGHVINFNCFENFGYFFLNELIKQIENNGIRVIATATNKEYSELESHFSKVIDYFTVIKLTELTKEQSEEIIKASIPMYEMAYRVKFPDNICEIVCENADRYVKNSVFPKKAETLLDEVCSYVSRKNVTDSELKRLMDVNADLKIDLIESLNSGNYNSCDEINKKIEEINEKIEKFNADKEKVEITENDVLEAIGFIVDVPMTKLSKDKTEFLKNLPDEIKKDIIGQDDTVDKIVKNIRRNQLGLRKKSHSAGNYMFIGSTGVGKTAFAKSLAKNLFGSEENMLRFDMSEFQTEVDVTKLLGSAPGYVGYKESGLLVKGLAKKPECVCLFDEIEKAHPKIYDVLLHLLDEGSITGSDGVKVDGSRALIIFTSNIGVKSAKELSNPMGFTENYEELKNKKEESIMRKALNKRFSPEFLNRLDSVCYFNNLSRDVLDKILVKEMNEMNKGIKNITGKEVVLSDEVRGWILEKVEKEHNGARPIIRFLQQEIEEEVANMVINEPEKLETGEDILTATLENEKIMLN